MDGMVSTPAPAPGAEADRPLRAAAAAALIGTSRATFLRLASRPDFPGAIHLTPTIRVWWRGELLAWVREQERRQRAQRVAATGGDA